jgi:hypothetical protein
MLEGPHAATNFERLKKVGVALFDDAPQAAGKPAGEGADSRTPANADSGPTDSETPPVSVTDQRRRKKHVRAVQRATKQRHRPPGRPISARRARPKPASTRQRQRAR